MNIRPGFYRIPEKEYHSGPGLSKSDMSKLLISPAHYKTEKKETKAMVQGSAFHTAVMEPTEMSNRFLVLPEGVTRAHKEGKLLMARAEFEGKELITSADVANNVAMAEAIWRHPLAKIILEEADYEISGYWFDTLYHDLLCRMRLDVLNTSKGIIADLKSTEDARPGRFQGLAWNMGYHIQAHWYSEGAKAITGVEHPDFYFIVVERTAPFGVHVYEADPELMEHGAIAARRAVELYLKCLKEDIWPCYPTDLLTLRVPKWANRQDINLTQIID